MSNINYFHNKTLRYDLLNKFNYKNIQEIPKLKKIILNFGCKTTDIKLVTSSLLALELITNQRGKITKTKAISIVLKIKKGNPAGCKVTLQKSRMLDFLFKTLVNIIPKLKSFNGFIITKKIKTNAFSYELKEIFSFSELEKQYYLFNNLSKLNITIITNCRIKKELIFLLRSFQFAFINLQI